MTSLASVFVEVRPDTTGFSSELKTSLAKTREAVDVAAKLDTKKLKPQLDALRAELKSITVTKATITADTVKASAQLKALKAEMKGLSDQVKINADDSAAKARITEIKAEIASIGNAKSKLSVDSSMASAHLKALQAQLAVFDGKDYTANVRVRGTDGVNFAFRGVSALTTAIVGLAPIATPALAAVAAGVGAVGSAFLSAGGAAGVYGGVLAGALANYKKDVQQLKALGKQLDSATDPAKIAAIKQSMADIKASWSSDEKEFDKLKDKFVESFQAIVKASGPATFGVLNSGMRVLIGLMPRMVPIINAVGTALSGLIADFGKFSGTHEFQGILDFFRVQGPAAITAFAHSAGNLLLGVFRLLQSFAPFQKSFLGGFERMTKSFADWAAGFGQSSQFRQFMDYAQKVMPEVRDLFVSLATFAGHFVTALAPLGSIELKVVTAFLDRLNQLPIGVLTALAGGITAVVLGLKAWELGVKAMTVSEGISKITGGLGKAMDDVRLRTSLATDAFKTARAESGRFGSALAGIKAGAAEAGGAFKTAFKGGVGIAGLALLTTDTSKASGAVNGLKNAAGGAAIGFSVAGPWGAAIGGAVGLLGGLWGASQKAKQAQKDLADQAKSTADTVAATLSQQTGAITRNTIETAKNALATGGVYDAAKTLGVSLNDVTSAYLGNADAAGRVGARIAEVRDAQGGEVHMSERSKNAWDKINAAVFATGGSFAATRRHIKEVNAVQGDFKNSSDSATGATRKLKVAQDGLKGAYGALSAAVQTAINKFTILRGDNLSQSAASDAYHNSVSSLTASLKSNGKQIGSNSKASLANRQAIRDAASALNDRVTADLKANKSTMGYKAAMEKARAETKAGKEELIRNITAITGNRTAAKKYVDYLIKNPARIKTETPGMDAAKKKINELKAQIWALRGLKVSPEIAVSFRAAALVANAQGAKNQGVLNRATGGPVFGAGTATSDSIPAMLSNGEHVWTAREVKAAGGQGAVEAIRSAVLKGKGLALAAGGPVVKLLGSSSGLQKTDNSIAAAIRTAGRAAKAAESAALALSRGPGGSFWPTTGHRISTYRGHDGVDINGPGQDYGNPIYAWRSGRISYTGYGRGYGDAIFEKVPGFPEVVYGHGSKVLVHAGQQVRGGQMIGRVGSTGHSSGPHLHFGVPGGTYAEALALLRGAGGRLPGGSGVTRFAGTVRQVLAALGASRGLVPSVLRRMNQESGGNPRAVNNWDSNARAGHPSTGLMQVIRGTYNAYRPHPDRGPYVNGVSEDPFSNIFAGLNYAKHRYGSIAYAMNKAGGYDQGGIARGVGMLPKYTPLPERVLSPRQTENHERLTDILDRISLDRGNAGGDTVIKVYDTDGVFQGMIRGVADDRIAAHSSFSATRGRQ